MTALVDTNVLLRSIQRQHPACRCAREALVALYRAGAVLFLSVQNVAEFWNVCTRPVAANGLGLSIRASDGYARQLERFFTILPESTLVFQHWRSIVVDYEVAGAKVHDARLVAMMRAHQISRIVTFNTADFTRYGGITVVHPETITENR